MKVTSVQAVMVDYSVENSFFKSNRTDVAEIEMAIVQVHIGATHREVKEIMEKHGMRPAEYSELMVLKEFPTLNEKYTVFASGCEILNGPFAGCFPCVQIENGSIVQRGVNRFGNDLSQPYFAAVYEK